MTATAREVARSRITLEELSADYHLGAQFLKEYGPAIGNSDEQRAYAVNMCANLDLDGLRFVAMMGECAKMVAVRLGGLKHHDDTR